MDSLARPQEVELGGRSDEVLEMAKLHPADTIACDDCSYLILFVSAIGRGGGETSPNKSSVSLKPGSDQEAGGVVRNFGGYHDNNFGG